jgi:hypothetical protein
MVWLGPQVEVALFGRGNGDLRYRICVGAHRRFAVRYGSYIRAGLFLTDSGGRAIISLAFACSRFLERD